MLDQLFPDRVDNTYRGYRVALWLFALVVSVKAIQSLASIFNGYSVATSADGIPVDTFTSAGARTIISLFAALGLSQFMICLLCALVLIRYRSMVPIMFALVLLHQLGGRLIARFLPIVRSGTPPGFYVNLALITVMIVGLALSLRRQGAPRAQPS